MKMPFAGRQFFLIAAATLFLAGSIAAASAQDQTTDAATPASTLPADVDPNSPLAQVIHLAQSGVEESVILAYINNSSAPFNLTSDQIIYLKDLGLPNDAVTAMMQRDQQLGASAPAAAQTTATVQPTAATVTAPPTEVTQNYFYDTLSPYGNWVNIDGYGLCWQPTVAIYNTSWQPYCDHGRWIYTDSGWYWYSDYGWGATAFHYGRWFRDPHRGWCWWPDTVWGPSWVVWRDTPANDYCGWAPLPPRAVYRPGAGLFFNGVAVSANFDFGLSINLFTFVPTKNFCDPHPRRYRAPQTQVVQIYNRTTIIHNYNVNTRDKGFVNNGIAPSRITAVSHQNIQRVTLRDSNRPVARGGQFNKNTLIVNRPRIDNNAVATLNRGVKPPVVRQTVTRPTVFNNNHNNPARPAQNRPVQNTRPNTVTQKTAIPQNHPNVPAKAAPKTNREPGFKPPYETPRQVHLKQQSRSIPYNRGARNPSRGNVQNVNHNSAPQPAPQLAPKQNQHQPPRRK